MNIVYLSHGDDEWNYQTLLKTVEYVLRNCDYESRYMALSIAGWAYRKGPLHPDYMISYINCIKSVLLKMQPGSELYSQIESLLWVIEKAYSLNEILYFI